MNHSLQNRRGGFVHFILTVVVIIILMNYFHISLDQVIAFIVQLINAIVALVTSIINSIVHAGQNIPTVSTPTA